ncbi:hypothetical protein ACTXPD_18535 [Vreelandella alkaliphila]|uniref:hypothetical protein n=1 Tax=Vreelandella alkaliphila TaxID=272774 RepID=UPI003FD77E34
MISWTYEQDAQQSSLGSDVRILPDPKGSGFSMFQKHKNRLGEGGYASLSVGGQQCLALQPG